jgi:hypothetical protein
MPNEEARRFDPETSPNFSTFANQRANNATLVYPPTSNYFRCKFYHLEDAHEPGSKFHFHAGRGHA